MNEGQLASAYRRDNERLEAWKAESDRRRAKYEADRANAHASFLRSRPRVTIEGRDVTEMVVSILDALQGSMDAGSGFLDDDTERAMEELATILKFDEYPKIKSPGFPTRPPEGWKP